MLSCEFIRSKNLEQPQTCSRVSLTAALIRTAGGSLAREHFRLCQPQSCRRCRRVRLQNARRATLTAAFFGADFDQALGEEDEAGHLHPFGDNVAYHLAPFALRIHRQEQEGPANPSDHDEYQKRMPVQKIDPRGTLFSFDWPALGRSDLIQKFRPQNDDNRTAPIGNSIAKKCTHMSF